MPCNRKLLHRVFCQHPGEKKNMHFGRPDKQYCGRNGIFYHSHCIEFLWYNNNVTLKQMTKNLIFTKDDLQIYGGVFGSVSTMKFPPIMVSHFRLITIKRVFDTLMYSSGQFVNGETKAGSLYILEYPTIIVRNHFKVNRFSCSDGGFVSPQFVCDGINDCSTEAASDETECHCTNSSEMSICKYVLHSKHKRECSHLYNFTHNGECLVYNLPNQNQHVDLGLKENFTCHDTSMIASDMIDDLVDDCYPEAEDEKQMQSLLQHYKYFECQHGDQIPCRYGHPRCFNFSDVCTYQLNAFQNLEICRTGEHLAKCEAFYCNVMYKCPSFYCISWTYVCDGKWDCPHGHDESSLQVCLDHKRCVGMFKCRKIQACIHLGQLCDEKADCALNDDEELCSLKDESCLKGCICLTFAIRCRNTILDVVLLMRNYHVIFLEQTDVAELRDKFCPAVFPTRILVARKSNLTEVCHYLWQKYSILFVDFSGNKISRIRHSCFYHLVSAGVMKIALNLITEISPMMFLGLHSLKFLNVSNNPVKAFLGNPFLNVPNLKFVSLMLAKEDAEAVSSTLPIDLFSDMKFLQTNDYHFCCLLEINTKCSKPFPKIFSCDRLLAGLKQCFYAISSTTLILNLISVIFHKLEDKNGEVTNNAFCLMICAINLGDVLCSLPLFVLSGADEWFGMVFFLFEEYWRSSPVCHGVSVALFHFSLTSPALLYLLSHQRFQLVCNPMKTNYKDSSFVKLRIFQILLVNFGLTALAVFGSVFNRYKVTNQFLMPTKICSLLFDPTGVLIVSQKVLVWVVFVGSVGVTLAIIVRYRLLLKSLKMSRDEIRSMGVAPQQKTSDTMLFVQISVSALSNLLCWVPSSGLLVASSLMTHFSTTVMLWSAVFVVLINSIMNPIIFCTVGLKKYVQKNKKISDRPRSVSVGMQMIS